jgi:hypothetical protein
MSGIAINIQTGEVKLCELSENDKAQMTEVARQYKARELAAKEKSETLRTKIATLFPDMTPEQQKFLADLRDAK